MEFLGAARVEQVVSHSFNHIIVFRDAVLEAGLVGAPAEFVAFGRRVVQHRVECLAGEITLVLDHWARIAAHFDYYIILFIIIK